MFEREFSLAADEWRTWFAERGRSDINLLLFAVWDPIGVSDSAITGGEYEHYVEDVFGYVQVDDLAGLTGYLRGVAEDAMGISYVELPVDAARRIINGAYASAWIWADRPLPND